MNKETNSNDPSSPTPPTETPACQPPDNGGVGCSAWLGDVNEAGNVDYISENLIARSTPEKIQKVIDFFNRK